MRKGALIMAISTVVLVGGLSSAGLGQEAERADQSDVERMLPMLSGGTAERIASRTQTTTGKSMAAETDATVASSPGPDVPVSAKERIHENEPSMAVHPAAPRAVAAFHHIPSDPCYFATSKNAGASWGNAIPLPLTRANDFCSDPVVRVSPDGAWFYIAYMSIHPDFTSDIAVFRVKGDLTQTNGPFVAIAGNRRDLFDKPWLDVHSFATDAAQVHKVYVSVTAFRGNGKCDIVFSRGGQYGTSWPIAGSPLVLATSGGFCGDPFVVQGSRPIGGPGANVLACWYNSERDGWGPGGGGPHFSIRCRNSADSGQSFGPEVRAARSLRWEVPFWTCPNSDLHRAWGSMFPSLAVGPDGSAHVVFTHDPTPGDGDGECGDVLYVSSPAPPYDKWTQPITVASGANSYQGYATIGATAVAGGCRLDVFHNDHRLSPPGSNLLYDVFHRQSDDCGATWGNPQRITDASSLSDFIFIGDYIDTASNASFVHVIWTDRRDKASIFDFEDDVFADRLPV
jgi:hypothetical protein